MGAPYSGKSAKERLMNMIARINGCWVWQGYTNHNGYGDMSTGRVVDGTHKNKRVHRVAYELFKGPIPEGLTIDHLCKNRACVNPDHLEAVTIKENIRRGNPAWKQNSKKTVCKFGHEFAGSNLYLWSGRRYCRTCRNSRLVMRRLKMKEGIA